MTFRTPYGYSVSENGWRMCNRDECEVVSVAGMNLVVRKGIPAKIMKAWLTWYHGNVERIDIYKPTDDWGWSETNDVGNSNHLSGTAVDINATQYPWGYRTMPADRIAKVRRGLALFEGTIFWGADWDRADEMHYQIGFPEGDARLTAFAKKLDGVTMASPYASLTDRQLLEKIAEQNKLILDQLGPDIWNNGRADLGKNPDGSSRYFREGLAALIKKAQA